MNKKNLKSLIMMCFIFIMATTPAMARADGKCEDYRRAIQDYCYGGSGGRSDGGIGACLGAQLGFLIFGC